MYESQLPKIAFFCTVVCSLHMPQTFGQVTLDPAWPENPKTFGGTEGEWASSVQQTRDGGYIVAGGTVSFGAGSSDVYLIKLDAVGNLDPAWDPNPKTFGGTEYETASSVQQTPDGGYIVGGVTSSFGAGSLDVYLIKLDARGNLDPGWDPNPKTFGGPDYDGVASVQPTTDGGYIVGGVTRSFGAGSSDVYLIKLDTHGNLDPGWDPNPKTFGGPDYDGVISLQQTTDGGYFVAGHGMNPYGPSHGWQGVYMMKLDSQGQLDPTWDTNPKTFIDWNMGDDWQAKSAQQTIDGGYIFAGRFVELPFMAGVRWKRESVYLKLDSNGNRDPGFRQICGCPSGREDWDHWTGRSVQQTIDGGYIIVGDIVGDGGDAFVTKLDAQGNLDPTWNLNPMTFGGGKAYSVRQTEDGGYIVAGVYWGGGDDVYLIKLAPVSGFLRGDCNDDGEVDLSDAVFQLMFNFLGGEAPPCQAACDANADGDIDGTADPIYTLTHRFLGGPPPPAPYPECGRETLPAETALDCGTPPVNCP